MPYSDEIRSALVKVPTNQIIIASDFKKIHFPDMPEAIYYKTLERMTKCDKLVHLTKGVYYRPEIVENELVPISNEAIVDYYVSMDGGMLVGEQILVEKGISSNTQARLKIWSNKLLESRKKIGDVEIEKSSLKFDEKTKAAVHSLELFDYCKEMDNLNKERMISAFHDISEEYADEVVKNVLEHKKYKKSTIAFMARVLDWYGVAHTLDEYLSSLSNYKIPSIEELRLDVPYNVQIKLQEYVIEVEKIYRNDLTHVILYGSYAKGNFNEKSDIDIMILVDLDAETINERAANLSDLTYEFNMKNNLEIKSMTQSESMFQKWKDVYPFYKSINSEGVRIYGVA